MSRQRREHGRSVDTSELKAMDEEGHHHMVDQLERVELRNRVLNLVRNGATASQVVEVMPELTEERVRRMVARYLDRIHTEDALTLEQMRALENQRLDALWMSLSGQIKNPDGSVNLKVVDRLTRLSERRSKMNGIEAAQRHDLFVHGGLAELGLEAEHIEAGRQRWLEQGGSDDDVVEGSVVE